MRGELVCIGAFSDLPFQLLNVRSNPAVNGTDEQLESG
jgi:hypothetical protein